MEVKLTNPAIADIEEIAKFLQEKYSNRAKTDFLAQLSDKFLFIEQMPLMYPAIEQDKSIRKCLVNPFIACFYRVLETEIHVLAIVDTRTNPNKIRF